VPARINKSAQSFHQSHLDMTSATAPSLTGEELDGLIYCARVGDLTNLKSNVTELLNSHSSTASQIVEAAIDWEADEPESSSGCCLLHSPAANGNEEVLGYFLSLLASKQDPAEGTMKNASGLVNQKNKNGNTPLHWAAVNGHISCVKALVAAGGDPTITNNAGHDALYEADCTGKEGGREVAEWILANCAGLEKGTNGDAGCVNNAAEDVDDADDVISQENNNT